VFPTQTADAGFLTQAVCPAPLALTLCTSSSMEQNRQTPHWDAESEGSSAPQTDDLCTSAAPNRTNRQRERRARSMRRGFRPSTRLDQSHDPVTVVRTTAS